MFAHIPGSTGSRCHPCDPLYDPFLSILGESRIEAGLFPQSQTTRMCCLLATCPQHTLGHTLWERTLTFSSDILTKTCTCMFILTQKINVLKFSKSKKGLECNSMTSQHEQTPGSISNCTQKKEHFKKERVNLYGIRGDPCDSCSWVWTYLVASAAYAVTCLCSPRSSGMRKQQTHESSRPLSIERPGAVHPWVSAQLRNSVQPSHLFIQDPTMPPNPAPNPLTQLEEARRRLEEEEKRANKLPSKQR